MADRFDISRVKQAFEPGSDELEQSSRKQRRCKFLNASWSLQGSHHFDYRNRFAWKKSHESMVPLNFKGDKSDCVFVLCFIKSPRGS
jgi:hypothetical protein